MAANLFDVNYYRQANPDLTQVGLQTDQEFTNHFFSFGINENRPFSRLADLSFYRASNSDLTGLDNSSLYNHLANFGIQEGRRFSPYYDSQFYRNANPDLVNAGLNFEGLYDHVQASGLPEERQFSPFFDIRYYRQSYGDLGGLNGYELLDHFKNFGLAEGRKSSRFVDVDFYLNYISAYLDLSPTATAINNNRVFAFKNLQSSGLAQGQRFSPIVDLDFYRDYHPDLAAFSNSDLFNHLVLSGSQEGRRLSVSYDPIFYLNANPDLTGKSSGELLGHFLDYGINEFRLSSDSYNGGFYLASNPDLTQNGLTAGQQALYHYEIKGLNEGRLSNNIGIVLSGTPGTFFGNAANLGALTNGRNGIINERVDNSSTSDVYRFTVASPSNVSLQISNLTALVNYQLAFDRNANGLLDVDEYINNIQTSTSSTIGGDLAEGTYYLVVQQAAANRPTNYRLNLATTALSGITTSRDPGESAATALDLGDLRLTDNAVEFKEFVGTADPSDIYRLTVDYIGGSIGRVFNISSSVTAEVIVDSNANGIFEAEETKFVESGSGNIRLLGGDLLDGQITLYIRITPNPATVRGTYSIG